MTSYLGGMSGAQRQEFFDYHASILEDARAEFTPALAKYLRKLHQCQVIEHPRPLEELLARALEDLDSIVSDEARPVLQHATQPGLLVNTTA